MFKENYKKYLAEIIGTAALVFVGCTAGVFAGVGGFNLLGVVLAFGLTVTMMAYSVGQLSGGHFNPAVTLAAWINKRVDGKNACFYVLSQIVGGILGGALLFALVKLAGMDSAGNMAANYVATSDSLFGNPAGEETYLGLSLLIEVIATFIFTLVIIGVTSNKKYGRIAGLVIGLTLAMLLMIAGPITNGSLNPARSLGVALFDKDNIGDVWVFILAPLVGGALGGLAGKFLFKPEAEEAQSE